MLRSVEMCFNVIQVTHITFFVLIVSFVEKHLRFAVKLYIYEMNLIMLFMQVNPHTYTLLYCPAALIV